MKLNNDEKVSLNCYNEDLFINNEMLINANKSTCSIQCLSVAKAFVTDISLYYSEKDFNLKVSYLGSGFFAKVYLLHHKERDLFMALKVPEPTEYISKFFKEIKLLKALDNKNILRFYGTCLFRGSFGYLTEFLDSGNLSCLIEKSGHSLDWSTRVKIAEDIAYGLAYLHGKFIVHRDLSAENILLSLLPSESTDEHLIHYRAVIADFGLFLNLKDSRADRMSTVGNPFYTAPENLKNESPYDYSSDVFSFGLLLCELITGLKNDPDQIPRTNNYGLDYKKLPIERDCPKWIQGLACDCCMVHISFRPTMKRAYQTIAENKIYINLWKKRTMTKTSSSRFCFFGKSNQSRAMSLSVSQQNYCSPAPFGADSIEDDDAIDGETDVPPKLKTCKLYRNNSVDSFLEPRLVNYAKAYKDPGYIDKPLEKSIGSLDPRVHSKLSRCTSESGYLHRSKIKVP